jgi:hypothetical protein
MEPIPNPTPIVSTQGKPSTNGGTGLTFWQKLGRGISTAWGAITGIVSSTGSEIDADGNRIVVRDAQTGEIVTEKNTRINWGGIVAAIGAIVGVVRGGEYTDPLTGRSYTQDGNFYNQQQYDQYKRTGRAIVILLSTTIVAIITILLLRRKAKK